VGVENLKTLLTSQFFRAWASLELVFSAGPVTEIFLIALVSLLLIFAEKQVVQRALSSRGLRRVS
jgi:hypothetical protein